MKVNIIRTLYGEIDNTKVKKEVIHSFKNDWVKENISYYVLGEDNVSLLHGLGAKNIIQIDKNNSVIPEEKKNVYTHFYNKTYLIQKAMNDNSEILFIDFDCSMIKQPDSRMWELLRSKEGRFNGSFQCPNVRYRNPVCLTENNGGVRKRRVNNLNNCLNLCFIYCNDKIWFDDFLEIYKTCPDRGNKPLFGGSEAVFMYYLDKKYGIMSVPEMVENFEPMVMKLVRGVGGKYDFKKFDVYLEKPKEDIYFSHF